MIALRKSADGRWHLLGRFTNRFRDTDFHAAPLKGGEIVSRAAHEEYAAWLDKNPQHAPELWIWHVYGSAMKNRANWWAFTGNFFWADWELTDEEAKGVADWRKELVESGSDLGMSHGFYVFDYDRRQSSIEQYRAFEASLLPIEAAANTWTGITLIAPRDGGKHKMLTDAKKRALAQIHGAEFAEQLVQLDQQMAELLDSAGIDSKELMEEPADAEAPVEAATEAPSEPAAMSEPAESKSEGEPATEGGEVAEQKDVAGPIAEREVPPLTEETVLEGMKRLHDALGADIRTLATQLEQVAAVISGQQELVGSLGKRLQAIEERVSAEDAEAKAAAAPVGLLAAFVPESILKRSSSSASDPEGTAVVDGRTALAKQAPKSTEAKEPTTDFWTLFINGS